MTCRSEWYQCSVDVYCDDVMGSLARDSKGTSQLLLDQQESFKARPKAESARRASLVSA